MTSLVAKKQWSECPKYPTLLVVGPFVKVGSLIYFGREEESGAMTQIEGRLSTLVAMESVVRGDLIGILRTSHTKMHIHDLVYPY